MYRTTIKGSVRLLYIKGFPLPGAAFIIFLLCFFAGFAEIQAQSRAELERQREQTIKEIEYTRKLIRETTEKQQESVSHLNLLNAQINSRQELIENYRKDIELLNAQIASNISVIEALENDLQRLRDEYAEMVRVAHRSRSGYSFLAFLLSSESFHQAYKRVQFMRYYAERRQRQIYLIELTNESLNRRVTELQEAQNEQRSLIRSVNKELATLESDRRQHAELIAILEGREEELRKEWKEKQKTAERLNRAIEDLIQREIEEAKRREAEVPDHKVQELELSEAFESNKLKLPWPVNGGIIAQRFGDQPHPTIKGVIIRNNGIDIHTNKGETARAVFKGEIGHVFNVPGVGNAILIRHGEYFTVYSNLGELLVEAGNQVETGTPIARISPDRDTGESILHFEVWKGKDALNPELWLLRTQP